MSKEVRPLNKYVDTYILSAMTGKKVYWFEESIPGFIRVHFDQERYLSASEDIPYEKINEFMKDNI